MVTSDPVVEIGLVGKGAKSKKKVELLRVPVGGVEENEPDVNQSVENGFAVNQSAPPPPSYEEYIQEIPIYPRLNGEWVPVVKQPTGFSVQNDPSSVLQDSSELSKVVAVETLPSEITNSQREAVVCPPDLDRIPPGELDGARASVTVSVEIEDKSNKRVGSGADILYDDGCEQDSSGFDPVASVEGAALEASMSGLTGEAEKNINSGVRLMSPRDFEVGMRSESEPELESESELGQGKRSGESVHIIPAEQVKFERNVLF